MAQTFLDEPYVVTTILNRVFNDQSPAHAVYNNQVARATSVGINTFALSFGASFTSLTEDQLSTKLLGNLGLLPNAGLQTALRDYLVSVGKASVGVVAMQLGQILSGLEQATGDQAAFNAAAVAWNKELVDSYKYSIDPYGVIAGPNVPVTGVTLSLTSGDDAISPAAAEARFKTTADKDTILATTAGFLSTADVIDGAEGLDTLRASLAAASKVTPRLRSVEKVYITAGAGAELGAGDTAGLQELWVYAAEGAATFSDVKLATSVGIQNSVTGGVLTVNFSDVSGPMDSANIVFADAVGRDEIVVANIEHLNVWSKAGTVAATTVNGAKISAAQAEKIVILGDQALVSTVTGARVSVVDASAFNSALDLALAGTAGGVAITANAQARHKLTLGDGADTLTITGLAGALAKDMDLGSAATLAASAIEVRGFSSGTDVIRLHGASSTAKVAPSDAQLASMAAATSLLDAVSLAATTAGSNKAIAFRHGADTYIFVNDGVAALGVNDSLVKLTGVDALADASWSIA
ncbi:hypothetical protein PMI14_04741 [Acidovorax sp. CF316]|uniref:hypothetical protein n=1 Tax=Acidovorax sp. CF316 TaxID=1144317 RepID=UPI00026BDBC6|nr:hypothetical protein [Acidovorax sp. CF316]EJE50564.1 hypothetical protein PMI14_04741 [Acidovorax sp. CF316]